MDQFMHRAFETSPRMIGKQPHFGARVPAREPVRKRILPRTRMKLGDGIRVSVIARDKPVANGFRPLGPCADRRKIARRNPFIGVDDQNPIPRAVPQRFITGRSEIIAPGKGVNTRVVRPGDLHGRVRRSRVHEAILAPKSRSPARHSASCSASSFTIIATEIKQGAPHSSGSSTVRLSTRAGGLARIGATSGGNGRIAPAATSALYVSRSTLSPLVTKRVAPLTVTPNWRTSPSGAGRRCL